MSAQRPPRENNALSDIELVALVLRSAPGAFEKFYGRYGQLIRSCIRKRAEARDVDDLFQGVFEHLIRNDYRVLQLWQRGNSLPIYLKRVVRNYVIDFQRRRRRPGESKMDTSDLEEALDNDPSAQWKLQETITTAIELKELRRSSIQAWAKLEVRDRKLMCDRLYRDMSNEALADRMKLTAGALRTAISRAQVRLLSLLRELAPEYFLDQV